MSHTVDTTTTDYFWDIARSLPVVLQDGTNTYVYGLDLIAAVDGSGDPTYFTYDGLGSTTDLTDESADVVAAYSYDVFGSIRSETGNSGNYWQFTGEQRDGDSALYFLRARYYDPEVGRFISTDPLPGSVLRPETQNLYPYVASNPVNRLDPSGMMFPPEGGGKSTYEGGTGTPCPTPTPTSTPGHRPGPGPSPIPPPPTPTPTSTPMPDEAVPVDFPITNDTCKGICRAICAGGCVALCAVVTEGWGAVFGCRVVCGLVGCNAACAGAICPAIKDVF